MFRPSAVEMVQYFSDFLNDVGEVVGSLKAYAYELASLPTPQPRLDHVYHSMSSIILSTHRTFQDLTRIRAVLATLSSARHHPRTPLSHASTTCRSRSQEDIFFSPRKRKAHSGLALFSFSRPQDETVRTRKIIKEDESSFSFENETVRRTRKLEGATPVKLLEKQSGETPVSTGEELPLMPVCLMQSIEERVRRLVRSNRQLQSRVSQRNQECLELLSTVKQELTLRG